ncbi:MAG: hypothetical protein ACREVB_08205, partial [Burkholderiales bacterium]
RWSLSLVRRLLLGWPLFLRGPLCLVLVMDWCLFRWSLSTRGLYREERDNADQAGKTFPQGFSLRFARGQAQNRFSLTSCFKGSPRFLSRLLRRILVRLALIIGDFVDFAP